MSGQADEVSRLGVVTEDGLGRAFGDLQWLADRVEAWRTCLKGQPFYSRLASAGSVEDFGWARQLFYHSREFPQVLAARFARCTDESRRSFMMEHVAVESGHSEMLWSWLLRHGLAGPGESYASVPATAATVACLSHCWRVVQVESADAQIIALNVATEAASWDFFSTVTPILAGLGLDDDYWQTHVVADQFHSAEGLELLAPVAPESDAGQTLSRVARESLQFWGFMLNSWVGVDRWPEL